MIVRASLTGSPAGDPLAHVAGLSVLLRQLLSLQDAGIEIVETATALPPAIAGDLRLVMKILVLDPGSLLTPATQSQRQPTLSVRPGLVWHPSLPKRLASGDSADIEAVALLPGEFVVPTSTPAERELAERLLFKTLFKPTDGIISRGFNRHVSLRVSRALLETSVTPNQMTFVAAVFGVAGMWIVLAQGMAGLVPGAILLQIQSILDGCDGELSRLKYLRSKVGEWLDQVFDDLVNLGYFLVVGWTLYQAGSTVAGWVALVGGVGHVVYQVSLYAGLVLRGGGSGSVASIAWWGQRSPTAPGTPVSTDAIGRIKEVIEMAGQRDFFTFLYLPTAVLGISIVALCWCGFVFAGTGAMTGLQWLVAGGPEKKA